MLRLTAVRKSYGSQAGEVEALKEVSLAIGAGELCAILGASGSGKSTLLNIAGLLDVPTSGTVFLAGTPTHDLAADEAARMRNEKIGFVFQAYHLLSQLSIVDNVALPLLYRGIGRQARREAARRQLARVGLVERLWDKPYALSGGQRQRVAIARALVGEPLLLLADEPTGNLDSRTASDIIDVFVDLNRRSGLTVVIITHDAAVATRCRRKIVLRDGQIITDTESEAPEPQPCL